MSAKGHKKKKNKSSKSRSQSVVSDKFINDYKDELPSSSSNSTTFGIKTSSVMGRYMVAAKELKPGDVILNELPIVVGPCTGCKMQCLACYQVIEQNGNYVKCSGCGWLLCKAKCEGVGKKYGHSLIECSILKECKSAAFLDYSNFDAMRENLYSIVPLRILILKSTDPDLFETIMKMEHHNQIRRKIEDLWNTNQEIIVNKILHEWKLTEFTSEEIHSICGILEVNAFEIGQQGINVRGLYPTAFLMSHNCIPNTNHCDEEKDYRLTVRASTQIFVDQPVTLCYAYTLQSTLKRREHLLESKFFHCSCDRCKDPTECGTYTGALQCPKCEDGLVLSTEPLNPLAPWKCMSSKKVCPGYSMSAASMELLTNRISKEIDEIDSINIQGMEDLLEKYRNVLHPTHYLSLELKLNLSQLYGKINNYLIHELSDDLLIRKMKICKEIIKIFDIVDPGFTRLRGVTLYELHAPVFMLATRQFEKQEIDKTQLKYRIKEVIRYLEESSIILSYEPKSSAEGLMGIAAKEALEKMMESCKMVSTRF